MKKSDELVWDLDQATECYAAVRFNSGGEALVTIGDCTNAKIEIPVSYLVYLKSKLLESGLWDESWLKEVA